ncbi:MAG: selenocysteine-specific translation elongation factor [bacterium]
MALVIGTAGHVDHGKTELIKALTGIDTDRLPEEKDRGMTIVLGFAFLDLPVSGRVGIVDVPGHEKFLKNMITGVYGIDVALLVVSADEGVMPQTEEHFQILSIAEIKKIIVVLTKVDITSENRIEETIFEVQTLFENTIYENSEIVKVSSKTGQGLDELKQLLDKTISAMPPKDVTGIPVLPVDRIFSLKGVGAVATGTLINGTLKLGDKISIYPRNLVSKVKQIQVHNDLKNEVDTGHRVGLNPANIKTEDINIGDIISYENAFLPTKIIDVKIQPKSKIVLKEWMRVKVHILTDEILGRVALLGDGKYCQILLERETVTWFKNKVIIRNYSPEYLIGGGMVLNPVPVRHKRKDSDVVKLLEIRENHNMKEIILEEIKNKNWKMEDLKKTLFSPNNEFDKTLQTMLNSGEVKLISKYLTDESTFAKIKNDILQELESFYKSSAAIKLGILKDELRKKLRLEAEFFDALIYELPEIEIVKDKLRLKTWKLTLSDTQLKELERVEQLSRSGPCSLAEFERETINILLQEKKVVNVKNEFFIHMDIFEGWKQVLKNHIETNKSMVIGDIKKLFGLSRKHTVAVAEYLDEIKFTKRTGDVRVLF